MGCSHSSAPFSGAGELCAAGSGAHGTAAKAPSIAARRTVRAARFVLLAAIRFYQVVLSPLMPSACKFYPSCSRYAAEAIARHGAKAGLRLAANRLWRCRPFTRGGYDPVPESLSQDDGCKDFDGESVNKIESSEVRA